MLDRYNKLYSFRLQTQAGFSLAEVVIASAISMVVALGVGRTLLQPIQERKKIESRSQAFSVVTEARNVLERRTLSSAPEECALDLTLPGFNVANAATAEGTPARIRLPRGAASIWIADGVTLPNERIRVENLTFANAEVFHRDLSVVPNVTYYNGQLFMNTSMLNPSGHKKGFTTQYGRSLIGGITIGVTPAGVVAKCSVLPEFEERQFCETIVDMNIQPGDDFCVADMLSQASLGGVQCAANEMFVGFTHGDEQTPGDDVTLPICVPQPEQDCRGQYFYLRGVRHNILIPGNTVEVSKPECRDTPSRQANARPAPPAPPVQVQLPSPLPPAPPAVDLITGPGSNGGSDCPSPAALDLYTTCVANKAALEASFSDRAATVICPAAPPARCYTPVAVVPPVNPAPAQVAPLPPPVTTTCQCGLDIINNTEYCGSYYLASYGFLYGTSEASMVMQCDSGVLRLQSDTNPGNPSAAPARVVVADPTAVTVERRSGGYGRVLKTGINNYVIP